MTTRSALADLLFPEVEQSIPELLALYPPREEKTVLRFAPSPTGYLHVGGLFTAFVGRKYAKQQGGKFILRIEDTDQKREIAGAAELFITSLVKFGIRFDEGPLKLDHEVGNYGPYYQSQRKHLYQVFAKHLVSQGLAYPCWMSEKELEEIRAMQTASKVIPGIYGKYSVWRDKTPDELLEKYHAENSTFPVLRFRSHANTTQKIVFNDLLRGQVAMIDNYNDIVLIKGDGLPTYHLAHVVDDTLMRITMITRGEEWLTSVPLHLQIFEAFQLPAPQYAHLAPISKLEEGKKRKFSKRKDPEANVEYFFEAGYPTQSLLEYIMTLADSAYEDWQRAHEDQNFLDFHFSLEKMNLAGPLFDFTKLQSIANNYLSKIATPQFYQESLEWAQKYHLELAQLMQKYPALTQSALDIERHTEKDPKRFTLYGDIEKGLLFFYPEQWERLKLEKPALPEHIPLETRKAFVDEYQDIFDLEIETVERFAQLKEIGEKHGFAANNAAFKAGGYLGKVGDLAMFLRIQLCGSTQTPDLFSVMKVLGRETVIERMLDLA